MSKLSRRDFLKGSVAAAVGTVALGGIAVAEENKETGPNLNGSWLNPECGVFNWRTPPEAPKDIAAVEEAELLVIGCGPSGMCAARSAMENGAKVTLLDARETYHINGHQCAAVNPSCVKEVGAEIDPAEFYNAYTQCHNERVNNRLIRRWIDESGKAFDWLEELMPSKEDLFRYILFWPPVENYKEVFKDAAYPHFIGSIDFTYGSWGEVGKLMYEKCVQMGVEFRFSTQVYMLTKDASGKVDGCYAYDAKEKVWKQYKASKGVVLCTGSFAESAMFMDINTEEMIRAMKNGNELPYWDPSYTSAGLKLAIWAGGVEEAWTQHGSSSNPCFGPTPGVSINKHGQRWRNEDQPIWMRSVGLRSQPDLYGWEIFDANWRELLPLTVFGHGAIDALNDTPDTILAEGSATRPDGTPVDGKHRYEEYLEMDILASVGDKEGVKFGSYLKKPGEVFAANTLDELADMMGLVGEYKENFLAEMANYNAMCEAGKDTQFGKRANLMKAVVKPPFIACGKNAPNSYSLGSVASAGGEGFLVDEKLRLLDKDHNPIPGLWGAGVGVGGRHACQYMTPMCGMNHGFCVTFGKLAGEEAAKA